VKRKQCILSFGSKTKLLLSVALQNTVLLRQEASVTLLLEVAPSRQKPFLFLLLLQVSGGHGLEMQLPGRKQKLILNTIYAQTGVNTVHKQHLLDFNIFPWSWHKFMQELLGHLLILMRHYINNKGLFYER
jgi:hypothetical protein